MKLLHQVLKESLLSLAAFQQWETESLRSVVLCRLCSAIDRCRFNSSSRARCYRGDGIVVVFFLQLKLGHHARDLPEASGQAQAEKHTRQSEDVKSQLECNIPCLQAVLAAVLARALTANRIYMEMTANLAVVLLSVVGLFRPRKLPKLQRANELFFAQQDRSVLDTMLPRLQGLCELLEQARATTDPAGFMFRGEMRMCFGVRKC